MNSGREGKAKEHHGSRRMPHQPTGIGPARHSVPMTGLAAMMDDQPRTGPPIGSTHQSSLIGISEFRKMRMLRISMNYEHQAR
jgi:hypothetical protein